MVLARLLTPQDFGLIAMVTAVTGFVALFKDAGLSMATVQRAEITQAQVSTLFWVNVALSCAVMLVVAALAPVLAWFYNEPRLVWITLALSATFVLGGLTVQHQALLQRQMRFKDLALVDIVSLAAGILTAVVLASMGATYWSLVGMVGGTAATNCLMVWLISGWRPGPPVRASGVRSMLRFGGGLTTFSALNYFTRNADNMIIGFSLGSGPLGIYSKGYGLLLMPIRQFSAPVSAVAVPALSRLQENPEAYRRFLRRAVSVLAFVGMPIVAFSAVAAHDLVRVLLGPSWGEVATVFQLLAPAALMGTLNVVPGWLCTSLGQTRKMVYWACFSAPIMVAGFAIGVRWGINGVAVAVSITWTCLQAWFIVYACRSSPVSWRDVLACAWRPLLSAAAGSAAVGLLSRAPVELGLPIVRVAVNLMGFGVTYLTVHSGLPGGRRELTSMLENMRHLRRRE